jgi:hypothetical protein
MVIFVQENGKANGCLAAKESAKNAIQVFTWTINTLVKVYQKVAWLPIPMEIVLHAITVINCAMEFVLQFHLMIIVLNMDTSVQEDGKEDGDMDAKEFVKNVNQDFI